ncbi:protein Mis18-beta [Tyto alba]|uniref:protein Mis18-beta n=1 Tax=Tyto alba TaxID=56313 RepID=UPI0014023420|nr:protein Mis18-beta [Tyto alba]
MALRRQLQQFVRSPLSAGSIVVEQPPAATEPSSRALLPPPPPPLLPPHCAVFHCRGCWAVLGDSLHLCAQEERWGLSLLVCFKVTNDVSWEDSLLFGLEGALLGCAYNALSCRSCGLVVGFILYSASSALAYLRGFFCFLKDSIICYLLEKQTSIEASKVNFPAVTLKGQLQELKEKLVETHTRIEKLIKQLQELEQKNNMSERQSSVSDAVDQEVEGSCA